MQPDDFDNNDGSEGPLPGEPLPDPAITRHFALSKARLFREGLIRSILDRPRNEAGFYKMLASIRKDKPPFADGKTDAEILAGFLAHHDAPGRNFDEVETSHRKWLSEVETMMLVRFADSEVM